MAITQFTRLLSETAPNIALRFERAVKCGYPQDIVTIVEKYPDYDYPTLSEKLSPKYAERSSEGHQLCLAALLSISLCQGQHGSFQGYLESDEWNGLKNQIDQMSKRKTGPAHIVQSLANPPALVKGYMPRPA